MRGIKTADKVFDAARIGWFVLAVSDESCYLLQMMPCAFFALRRAKLELK
jgi:hypothetical protein